MYTKVDLKDKARYGEDFVVSNEKVEKAARISLEILKHDAVKFGDNMVAFPGPWNDYGIYKGVSDVTWTTGLWTGVYWLAYELTGDNFYREVAESHLKHYIEKAKKPEELGDHDTGFMYIPSCIAAYKLTGNGEAKEAALSAAETLYEHCCPVNKFIIRAGKGSPEERYDGYRMLVDSMMNVEILFWAYEQTGDKKYYDMGVGHYKATTIYLIKEDGSSYHHYQFDPTTKEPVKGVTLQGNRDESCWVRGHSWLIYGYPQVYKYVNDKEIIDIHSAVSYYLMDNIPKDYITYWDFDFTDGSIEPRDTSGSAISACGLLEMCKYLPEGSEQRRWYSNAAHRMIDALIDAAANKDTNKDCLLNGIVGSRRHNLAVCAANTYGDYFYFEALIRILKPDVKLFW